MAEEDTELEEFFETEEESEVEAEEETEEEKVEESNESNDSEEQEKSEEPDESDETETTSDKDKADDLVPRAALLDERRKRQQMEERLAKLESQLPPEEEDLPDPYEDREAYETALRQKWEREQAQKAERERLQKIEERRTKMLEDHDDFLEKERIFEILSVRDSQVRNEMLESNDPVEYAYNKATEYYNEVMKPEKVLSTEMPDESEFTEKKVKEKPNLAKETASAKNSVEIEQESTLEDVFADQPY